MSDFTFENQGTNTYLVYTILDEDTVDTMSLGMLTNNKIPGLATTLFTQMDATKYIKYNVSAKVSVRQFFSGAVNKKRLLGVFKGIVNALLSAEDYMIDENSILLDLDYIFADVSSCETVLICLPVIGKEQSHNLGDFFKGIMFSTQFDQTENCDHVAKIINYLNSAPTFSLEDFKNLLFEIDQVPSVKPVQVSQIPKQPQQNVVQKNETPARPVIPAAPNTNIPSGIPVSQGRPPVNPSAAVSQQPSKNNIPVPPVTPPASQPQADSGMEKKISMFGLLMHYNKENAELYKAQKAAKKAGQAPSVSSAPKTHPSNFAVPGTSAHNQGFAIPGQSEQIPMGIPVPQQQASQGNNVTSAPQQQTQTPVQQALQSYAPQQKMPQGQSANFGETTVLNKGKVGETTVLDSSKAGTTRKATPILVRRKNNEKIPVNKPVFRIGKEKSYVDYFVSDNTAVSRSHADIITRDGKFFIVDTNSTNHTYVNGAMIQSNMETPLNSGDTVRLANEEFEFKIV